MKLHTAVCDSRYGLTCTCITSTQPDCIYCKGEETGGQVWRQCGPCAARFNSAQMDAAQVLESRALRVASKNA